jgi:hypothetical protein
MVLSPLRHVDSLPKSMEYTVAQIEEARRLAQQAQTQVTAQVEMIDRMKRSGLSTAVAEEALRMMRKLHADLLKRLKGMLGVKVD